MRTMKKAKTVRELIEGAGISQRSAARALGVDERSFRRWCQDPEAKGYRAPPFSAVELLRRMIEAGEIPKQD